MSGIISKENLVKIESLRTGILKAAVWVLVGGVILGALMILSNGTSGSEIMGKFMGTLFLIALMMIVCVNNFKMMKIEEAPVQFFAVIGALSNLVWALLWIIIVWNPRLMNDTSLLFKFAAAFSCLSFIGLLGSNVMAIYEGEKRGMIRPLKITAVACATYEALYVIVTIFAGFDEKNDFADRLNKLAFFVGFVWFWIVVAAVVISNNEMKKQSGEKDGTKADTKSSKPKTDDELRAEIEEKVRREMIEKEVRERMEKNGGTGSGSLGA